MNTRGKILYFYTLSLSVTLKIEPRVQKVDTSEILSMVSICLNLKVIKMFRNITDKRCTIQYFPILDPTVTFQIEPSQVDTSEILSMITTYPNLKAIGEIL